MKNLSIPQLLKNQLYILINLQSIIFFCLVGLLSQCTPKDVQKEGCASHTDDGTVDYTGPNQKVISDILLAARPWRIASCKGATDYQYPNTFGNGCVRDSYVDAAIKAAWAVEYQWRTGQKDLAISNAAVVRQNLDYADALCSNRDLPTACSNCECGTIKIYPCNGKTGSGSGTFIETTIVKFTNPAFTPITVTVNGTSQVVEVGSTVTFQGQAGTSLKYHAETSGKTTQGTQIGLLISWDGDDIYPTSGTKTFNLSVSQDFFFLYIVNQSSRKTTKLLVNYGLQAQTTDNINIPNDKIKYRTGYYRAYSNSNIRLEGENNAIWNLSSSDLKLPNTQNQSYTFTVQ